MSSYYPIGIFRSIVYGVWSQTFPFFLTFMMDDGENANTYVDYTKQAHVLYV